MTLAITSFIAVTCSCHILAYLHYIAYLQLPYKFSLNREINVFLNDLKKTQAQFIEFAWLLKIALKHYF